MGLVMIMLVPSAGLGAMETRSKVRRQALSAKTTLDRGQADEQAWDEPPSGDAAKSSQRMNLADAIAAIREELGLPGGTPAKDVSMSCRSSTERLSASISAALCFKHWS